MVSMREEVVVATPGLNRYEVSPALAERIGVVVSSIIILYLISPLLKVPFLNLPLVVLGSPLHLGMSRELIVGIVAGLLAWVGSHAILALHPAYAVGTRVYSHRILPALMAIASSVLWQRQEPNAIEDRLIMAAAIGLALSLVLLGQYMAVMEDSPWVLRLRTVLSVISLSVGLYLLIMIYGTRTRSLVTATAVALLTGCLAIDILQYETVREWRMLRAAMVIGLIVGECAWALNYWRMSPLRAGFILLVVTYVLVGITRRLFQETLTPLALMEHAVMAGLLLFVMQHLT